MARVRWVHVLDAARGIASGYDQRMTPSQLFYRLVVDKELPNLQS